MNQEKELLEKVKEQYAKSVGYDTWGGVLKDSNKAEVAMALNIISKDYANELLKLRLGEVRKEIGKEWMLKDSFENNCYNDGLEVALEAIDKTLKSIKL